jgi:hypothetical protein
MQTHSRSEGEGRRCGGNSLGLGGAALGSFLLVTGAAVEEQRAGAKLCVLALVRPHFGSDA